MTDTAAYIPPLKMTVHPGIGDLMWLISKFTRCGRQLDLTVCQDHTFRSGPFLDLLPCVYDYRYSEDGQLDYLQLKRCWNGTYAEIVDAEAKGHKIYLSCNNWLDNGNRLEEWFPDLPTDFHPDIPLPHEAVVSAADFLPPGAMYIGIHTSSMASIRAWDGWEVGEWTDFIRQVNEDYPHVVFVLIGATYDTDMAVQLVPALEQLHIPFVNLVGSTALPLTFAVMRRCRYFVGFACGMAIMANVMRIPVTMLYPTHQRLLMNAWPSLESIASGSYVGMAWERPKTVYRRVGMLIQRALS